MKAAFLIFVILFAGWQVGHAKELGPEEEECITELKLDRDEMIRLDAQKVGPEVSSDFNEYVLCFCKKTGLMNSNGDFNYDKIIDLMIDEVRRHRSTTPESESRFRQALTPSIETCKQNSPTGSTHAETAVKALKCVDKYITQNIGG